MPQYIDVNTVEDPSIRQKLQEMYGNQGFGKVMKSPQVLAAEDAMNVAAQNAGNNMDDGDAIALMNSGMNRAVPYGGKLSPLQALNDGLRQGIGMYQLGESQKSRKEASDALVKYLRAKSENDIQKPISADGSDPFAKPFKQDPYTRSDLLSGDSVG